MLGRGLGIPVPNFSVILHIVFDNVNMYLLSKENIFFFMQFCIYFCHLDSFQIQMKKVKANIWLSFTITRHGLQGNNKLWKKCDFFVVFYVQCNKFWYHTLWLELNYYSPCILLVDQSEMRKKTIFAVRWPGRCALYTI